MKKSLLTILGASFFASLSFAQVVTDTTYDVSWYDTLDSKFCVKLDPSNVKLGLKGLCVDNIAEQWKATTNDVAKNDITVENGKLTIVHKRLTMKDNWTDITLVTTNWVGGTTKKFGADADTLAGMYVDMQGDVKVQATIQTDIACNLRLDLVDVNGHTGNSGTQRYQLEAGAAKNYEFDFSTDNLYGVKLFDFYSGDFYGVENGRYANTQLKFGPAAGDTIDYGAQAFIPCRTDGINRLSFTINDASDKGSVEDGAITVIMTNLTIGNPVFAANFVPYTQENVDAGKIAFNPAKVVVANYINKDGVGTKIGVSTAVGITSASALEVYPNPAKGQITVNEDVTVKTVGGVATAVSGTGVLDISSLVAGTYYVVGTTGTATLVVE